MLYLLPFLMAFGDLTRRSTSATWKASASPRATFPPTRRSLKMCSRCSTRSESGIGTPWRSWWGYRCRIGARMGYVRERKHSFLHDKTQGATVGPFWLKMDSGNMYQMLLWLLLPGIVNVPGIWRCNADAIAGGHSSALHAGRCGTRLWSAPGTRGKTSDSWRCCLQRFFQHRWNVQYYPMVPVWQPFKQPMWDQYTTWRGEFFL